MKKALPLVSLGALYALFLSLAFAAGYYTRAITPETRSAARPLPLPGLSAPSYALLDEARRVLEAHSINPLPDDQALEYGAIRGLVSALGDQYTVFVEPQAHELETQSLQGEYGGIGVGISQNQTGEIVLSPFPDSPALRAGLVEGDILLAVDSALTAAPTTSSAAATAANISCSPRTWSRAGPFRPTAGRRPLRASGHAPESRPG